MKTLTPAFGTLLLFLFVFSAEETRSQEKKTFLRTKGTPILATEPEILDFGEILSGESRMLRLNIINKGDAELMLLKPGQSARLDLEYTSIGQEGSVKKKISLHSNDPRQRKHSIDVLARIKTAFTAEPRWLHFDDVEKGQSISRSTLIRSIRAGTFKITGITGLPPYFTYEVKPLEEADVPSVGLTLTLNEDAPVGSANLKLKLNIESERIKEYHVNIYLNVLPPVSCQTGSSGRDDLINFGVIPRGKGAVKIIEIRNKIPEIPYDITDMVFTSKYSDFIEARLVTEEKGIHYKLFITVKPEINCRFFRGTITLSSDHPDLEKKELGIKGWISKR